MLKKIISGGQIGADQAALDTAVKLGIPHGGWIPKGRMTENGILPDKYELKEMPTSSYPKRTEQNVIDSDGTIIFSHGSLTGGSALTIKLARKHNKPCLHFDLDEIPEFNVAQTLSRWISMNRIGTLNIAGSRASEDPQIYTKVCNIIQSTYHIILTQYPKFQAAEPAIVKEIVDDLISKLSLKEKIGIANMELSNVESLDFVFSSYIKIKTGIGPEDKKEYSIILKELWKKLRDSHRLRVVK